MMMIGAATWDRLIEVELGEERLPSLSEAEVDEQHDRDHEDGRPRAAAPKRRAARWHPARRAPRRGAGGAGARPRDVACSLRRSRSPWPSRFPYPARQHRWRTNAPVTGPALQARFPPPARLCTWLCLGATRHQVLVVAIGLLIGPDRVTSVCGRGRALEPGLAWTGRGRRCAWSRTSGRCRCRPGRPGRRTGCTGTGRAPAGSPAGTASWSMVKSIWPALIAFSVAAWSGRTRRPGS